MKRFLFLAALCLPLGAFAQVSTVDVASDLSKVTVFLNGAQVHRTASVRLPAGRSEARFTGLDPELNPESIQLNASGVTVLSVTHRINFLDPAPATAQAEDLRARIAVKKDSIAIEQMLREVYEQEEVMLTANQAIGGTANGVQLAQLESAANFFRQRMTEIKSTRLVHQKRAAALQEEVQQLESQLQKVMGSLQPAPASEIVVLVERTTGGASDFALSYVTRRAGWRPLYDLRVDDVSKPLALHYKASIQQFTGEDWENARLTLSTADPSQRGVKPQLYPEYVRFYRPMEAVRQTKARRATGFSRAIPGRRNNNPSIVTGTVRDLSGNPLPGASVYCRETSVGIAADASGRYELSLPEGSQTLSVDFVGFQGISTALISDRIDFVLAESNVALDEVVVQVQGAIANMPPPPMEMEEDAMAYVAVETRSNTTSIEFEIDVPYTIASGAEPSLVDIAQHEIEAAYEYYVAPAKSRDAFLTARMTGWEVFNLLSGEANLFFDNTFVGQSYFDMQNVSDTLDLSLGSDQGIVIKRTRLEEFSKKQFLSNRRTDTSAFEIEVRNAKAVPVRIVVEDQIPLSSDGSIEVSLEENGGARYTEETGMLRWEFQIPPAATETVQFRYTVRYPKDRQIVTGPR